MESESERLTGLHTIEQLKAEIAAMKGLTSLNGVSEGSGCDKTVSEETSKVFCDKVWLIQALLFIIFQQLRLSLFVL